MKRLRKRAEERMKMKSLQMENLENLMMGVRKYKKEQMEVKFGRMMRVEGVRVFVELQ